MQKNILISVLVSLALIGGAWFLVSGGEVAETRNVTVRDGVQYVTILAKGGYSPRLSKVQAGLPTKIVVETQGTYDCSAALVVRAANFQKILSPSGQETIDLGAFEAGEKVRGVCGMGMYSFEIKAE